MLLLAITGHVWAGVCGCFDDHSDSDPCCKPAGSDRTSAAAKPCCVTDCGSVANSQIPGKNTERVSVDASYHFKPLVSTSESFFAAALLLTPKFTYTASPGQHRLKLARPPDALYLRHNAFLI